MLLVSHGSAFLNRDRIEGDECSLSNTKSVDKVPIWEKMNLTIEEASEYSNIGINKIREISSNDNCPFVLWIGNKRLIKRRKFDEYIEKIYSL